MLKRICCFMFGIILLLFAFFYKIPSKSELHEKCGKLITYYFKDKYIYYNPAYFLLENDNKTYYTKFVKSYTANNLFTSNCQVCFYIKNDTTSNPIEVYGLIINGHEYQSLEKHLNSERINIRVWCSIIGIVSIIASFL